VKTPSFCLLIGLLVLTGCATPYVLRLTNGSEILTPGKPQLKGGIYYFKDANGERHAVMAASVREIAPASMVKAEDKSQPVKMKSDKKRKWYLLWLG
jgi:hypothetical protein